MILDLLIETVVVLNMFLAVNMNCATRFLSVLILI